MKSSKSFSCARKFDGDRFFRYGLSRSGEFTYSQVALLELHGRAYQDLEHGEREPVNQEEKDFIKVCQGLKQAETVHERVWQQFRRKTQAQKPYPVFRGGNEEPEVHYHPEDSHE